MRRALALSWAVGTSTGILLGLFGVQLVTSGITAARIAPLSRPEVLQALSAATAEEPTEAVAAPPAAPPSPADIGSAPPLPDPVSEPAPKPPASAPPRPGATAGTTTTTAPPPPPAPPPTSRPPPPPPAVAPPAPPEPTTTTTRRGEVRTISSRGGTVAVRYQDGQVRLLWARPDSGYDVVVEDDGPEQVYVRFRSGGSRSFVYAYYEDGKPAEEVVERGGGRDRDVESNQDAPIRQQSEWSEDDLDRWSGEGERDRR